LPTTICVLEPFISKYKLLVTPVVALLTDLAVLDSLKASEAEVDRIFDHPLEALLDLSLANKEPLVATGSNDWWYEAEYHASRVSHLAYDILTTPSELIGRAIALAWRLDLSHASFSQYSFPNCNQHQIF